MCSFGAPQQGAANAASCPRRDLSVSFASPTSSPACETSSRPSSSSGLTSFAGSSRPLRSGFPGGLRLRSGPSSRRPSSSSRRPSSSSGAAFFFGAALAAGAAGFGAGGGWRLRSGRRWRLRSRTGPRASGAARAAGEPRARSRASGAGRRSGGRRGLRRDRDARGPEHLLGVVLRVDLVEDVADSPVLAHEERLAQRTDSPRGIRVLAPGAIGLVHGVIGIRQELERQVVLGGERVVRRGVVARDSEDLDPGALQVAPAVAQAARFARASGSVVFRVEIDQNVLATTIVMQRDRLARASRKREIGSGRTGTQGRGSLHFIGHLAVPPAAKDIKVTRPARAGSGRAFRSTSFSTRSVSSRYIRKPRISL